MIEYSRHLEEYLNYSHANFSKLVPQNLWGNKKLAEEYFKKYWLLEEEYQKVWRPIQNKIFIEGESLPNFIYSPDFKMIALRGGCLFAKEDFELLQKAMQEIDEKQFVIVQHSQEFTHGEPMFRMKYPVNITWEELVSGNYISAVLFEMNYNEYFVFGESANWGKYSANDYEYPLDIIGFKSEYATIFKEHFELSKEEQDEIREWLPPKYKEIVE